MNQCVPSWSLEDGFDSKSPSHQLLHSSTSTVDPQLPMSSFEVNELTWEHGHLPAHGPVKSRAIYHPSVVAGTLECIVNQAKVIHNQLPAANDATVPAQHHRHNKDLASGIGSCFNIKKSNKRTRNAKPEDNNTMTTVRSRDNTICNTDDFGFTPTDSIGGSPDTENTCLNGGGGSRQLTIADYHDSVCHRRLSQSHGGLLKRELNGEEDGKVTEGGTVNDNASTKRSRAVAIHNQSEKKRRDKMNQKMRTLQKLIPSSSKTDKASLLDEVIEYLKQLQAQVMIMSKMGGMPSMMMPIGMQQFQMAMITQMAQMAQMAQMGMAIMNMSTLSTTGQPMGIPHVLPTSAFMPCIGGGATAWDPSVDCMQQPADVTPDPFPMFVACQPQIDQENYSENGSAKSKEDSIQVYSSY